MNAQVRDSLQEIKYMKFLMAESQARHYQAIALLAIAEALSNIVYELRGENGK